MRCQSGRLQLLEMTNQAFVGFNGSGMAIDKELWMTRVHKAWAIAALICKAEVVMKCMV